MAIELERLIGRDQLAFDEAVQTLTARQVATAADCEAVWVQLPRRPRRTRVNEEVLATVAGPSLASDALEDEASRAEATALGDALARAISQLAPVDQTLLRLRYWSGQTVARIAALTGDDQKALYRRFERLAAELRRTLEAAGLNARSLAVLEQRFAAGEVSVRMAELVTENTGDRPSIHRTGGEHA